MLDRRLAGGRDLLLLLGGLLNRLDGGRRNGGRACELPVLVSGLCWNGRLLGNRGCGQIFVVVDVAAERVLCQLTESFLLS